MKTGIFRHVARTWFAVVFALGGLVSAGDAAAQTACVDNLAARAKTGQVQLTWTHASDTALYTVQRSAAASGPFGTIGTTTSTVSTFLDEAPLAGIVSYYRIVRSFAGGSCTSAVIGALPPAGRTRMATVPNVVGSTAAAAQSAIVTASLAVGPVSRVASPTVPLDNVISQNPPAGSALPVGSAVALEVSSGPAPVTVPNVVGLSQAAATAAITNAGLVLGTVTTQSSASVAAGNVISQNPPGGASVSPGSAVALVVSTGPANGVTSVDVNLNSAVAGAGGTLDILLKAFSSGGQQITPTPAVTFEVLFDPNFVSGTVPSVSGLQIVTGATTRGPYTLRVTVNGTSVRDTVDFVVIQGGSAPSSNSGKFVTLGRSVGGSAVALDDIAAALAAGNNAAVPTLRAQLVAARNAVIVDPTNRNTIQRSTVVAPDRGFMPSPSALTAAGFPETADDVALGALLPQIVAKLDQIAAFYRNLNPSSPTDDVAVLNQRNAELAALQAQLDGLNPSPHGIAKHASAINSLYAKTFPNHLRDVLARVDAVLVANGFASTGATPAEFLAAGDELQRVAATMTPGEFYAHPDPAFFGLVGLMSGTGLQMNLVNRIYGPLLADLSRAFVVLAASSLLSNYLDATNLQGIIAGASQSIFVFRQPNSVIEISGFTALDPARADVYLVGTNAVSAVEGLLTSFVPGNMNSIQDVYNFFEGIIDAMQAAGEAFAEAHQLAGSVQNSCILDGGSSPSCRQLVYPAGFASVNTCSGFICFPQPVLVLVKNLDDGGWGYGVFSFQSTR
jgi:hypothetical protein